MGTPLLTKVPSVRLNREIATLLKTGPKTGKPARRAERNWQVLVGAAADGELCRAYRYTTTAPAVEWAGEAFDDSGWKMARAPFGTINRPRTPWNTPDIWLRQTFDWSGASLQEAALVIFYDEDTEVFVNGQKIWHRSGFTTTYDIFTITDALRKALKKGTNTLAVHTHQTGGGQFIDLALLWEPQARYQKGT